MATIKDVAKLAGVNPSTVSRAIADNPRITKETKEKVFKAMEELHYKPNEIARSLAKQGRTKIIGVILPSNNEQLFHNPFFIQVISSISSYAQDKGYYIMHGHSREEKKEIQILDEMVTSRWLDGVILTTVRDNDKCVQYLNETEMPYVVIGKAGNTNSKYSVDNDNMDAMFKATSHMFRQGHKKIVYIGGSSEFTVNNDRREGYKKAMRENGLGFNDSMIFEKDDSEQCGEEGMSKFIKEFIPDAVVTTDDLIAYGACQKAYEITGKFIPVIGFNNTPISKYRNPAFSTIDIFADKLGLNSAKLLIDQFEGIPIKEKHLIVKTQLIDRT